MDLTPNPRHLDMTIVEGRPEIRGQLLQGIYTRDGGVLKLRVDEMRQGRPKDFGADGPSPVMYFLPEGAEAKLRDSLIPKPGADRIRDLQKARVKALETQLQGQFERVKIGKDPLSTYITVVRELADAEAELAETKEAKVAALDRALRSLHVCVEQLEQLHAAGLQTKEGVAQAKAAKLKVEIELEKLKAEK